jgi:hypothetical protein
MALSTVVADVMWNFDIIGSINIHQTLLVNGDKLNFENRYFQFIRRTITSDGREQILQTIDKTFTICEEILHSYQCNMYVNTEQFENLHQEQLEIVSTIYDTLHNFIDRKKSVMNGLKVLSSFERYNDDPAFRIEIKRFNDRLEKIMKKCEQLKSRMKHLFVNSGGLEKSTELESKTVTS